jgi:2-keto-myo-inositol isomerase
VRAEPTDQMLPFALNHMTAPALRFDALAALASRTGCIGVELRNDLGRPLFDGADPTDVRDVMAGAGLRLLALAEVKAFNDGSDRVLAEAEALADIAVAAGAEAVALIPRNDGERTSLDLVRDDLRAALTKLRPVFEARGLVGLIEPLGFATCGLRQKADVVAVIDELGAGGRFKLIHDTFHHHLAGGGPIYGAHTGLVHISGVTEPSITTDQMRDPHRGHVDAADRLDNLAQLRALHGAGYSGALSVEAFAPCVHRATDPEGALSGSFNFIASQFSREAA